MAMAHDAQGEFDFNLKGSGEGFHAWRRQREATITRLGRNMGLPIGHPVDLWLKDGVHLKGCLRLKEEWLLVDNRRDPHLQLVVDGVPFEAAEIESCVRLD